MPFKCSGLACCPRPESSSRLDDLFDSCRDCASSANDVDGRNILAHELVVCYSPCLRKSALAIRLDASKLWRRTPTYYVSFWLCARVARPASKMATPRDSPSATGSACAVRLECRAIVGYSRDSTSPQGIAQPPQSPVTPSHELPACGVCINSGLPSVGSLCSTIVKHQNGQRGVRQGKGRHRAYPHGR
jgi:hypothetical protein